MAEKKDEQGKESTLGEQVVDTAVSKSADIPAQEEAASLDVADVVEGVEADVAAAVELTEQAEPAETVAQAEAETESSKAETESGKSSVEGKSVKKSSRSKRKFVIEGEAHITASFNNTIVSITDLRGNVLAWSSAGACGFKGSKKGTPHAGQLAAAAAARVVTDPKLGCGMERIKVYVSGFGPSRDSVIRALAASFQITALIDTTSVPFNGCRSPKERRV